MAFFLIIFIALCWICFSSSVSFVPEEPRTEHNTPDVNRAEERGGITSLDLLSMFFLMSSGYHQPPWPPGLCCLRNSFLSNRTPRSFFSELLPSRSAPSLCWVIIPQVQGPALTFFEVCYLPLHPTLQSAKVSGMAMTFIFFPFLMGNLVKIIPKCSWCKPCSI